MRVRTAVVGTAGFEPATSCSQSRRAAKLRYVPWRDRPAGAARHAPSVGHRTTDVSSAPPMPVASRRCQPCVSLSSTWAAARST
jgi:hypothetical protein